VPEDETVEVDNVDTWGAPIHPLESPADGTGNYVDPTVEVFEREAKSAEEAAAEEEVPPSDGL
jgi:hypothetical protein